MSTYISIHIHNTRHAQPAQGGCTCQLLDEHVDPSCLPIGHTTGQGSRWHLSSLVSVGEPKRYLPPEKWPPRERKILKQRRGCPVRLTGWLTSGKNHMPGLHTVPATQAWCTPSWAAGCAPGGPDSPLPEGCLLLASKVLPTET